MGAVRIEERFILEETENGFLSNMVPCLKPFMKILHQKKERIIDSVLLNSAEKTMQVEFADE